MKPSYRFDPFVLDGRAYRLMRGETPLELPPKVLDLLFLLAAKPGALLTKEDIFDALWPGVSVTDNAITQVVSDLRQALGDTPASPAFVQTVPRRGYRFIASVTVVDNGAQTPSRPQHHMPVRPIRRPLRAARARRCRRPEAPRDCRDGVQQPERRRVAELARRRHRRNDDARSARGEGPGRHRSGDGRAGRATGRRRRARAGSARGRQRAARGRQAADYGARRGRRHAPGADARACRRADGGDLRSAGCAGHTALRRPAGERVAGRRGADARARYVEPRRVPRADRGPAQAGNARSGRGAWRDGGLRARAAARPALCPCACGTCARVFLEVPGLARVRIARSGRAGECRGARPPRRGARIRSRRGALVARAVPGVLRQAGRGRRGRAGWRWRSSPATGGISSDTAWRRGEASGSTRSIAWRCCFRRSGSRTSAARWCTSHAATWRAPHARSRPAWRSRTRMGTW